MADETGVMAKFKVHSIEIVPPMGSKPKGMTVYRRVKLIPIAGEVFGSEDPSGLLDMLVVVPELADMFEIHGEYDIFVRRSKPGMRVVVSI